MHSRACMLSLPLWSWYDSACRSCQSRRCCIEREQRGKHLALAVSRSKGRAFLRHCAKLRSCGVSPTQRRQLSYPSQRGASTSSPSWTQSSASNCFTSAVMTAAKTTVTLVTLIPTAVPPSVFNPQRAPWERGEHSARSAAAPLHAKPRQHRPGPGRRECGGHLSAERNEWSRIAASSFADVCLSESVCLRRGSFSTSLATSPLLHLSPPLSTSLHLSPPLSTSLHM